MKRYRVYIAGAISKGNLAQNVNRATTAFVALAKSGFSPLCPHWSVYSKACYPGVIGDTSGHGFDLDRDDEYHCVGTRSGNDAMTHEDWLGVDLPWVEVSDALLRLPGESTGADREVEHARRHGVPVFFSIHELAQWAVAKDREVDRQALEEHWRHQELSKLKQNEPADSYPAVPATGEVPLLCDVVPALLDPGYSFIPRVVVDRLGIDNLSRINDIHIIESSP